MMKKRPRLWRWVRLLLAACMFAVGSLALLLWWNWPASTPSSRELAAYKQAYKTRPLAAYEQPLKEAYDRIVARITKLAPDYPQLSGFPRQATFGRLGFEYDKGTIDWVHGKMGPPVYNPPTACSLSLKLSWRADLQRYNARVAELHQKSYEEYKARGVHVFQTINLPLEEPATNGIVSPGSGDIIPGEARYLLRFFADPNLPSSKELAAKIAAIVREESDRLRPALEKFVPTHGTPSLPVPVRK